MAYCCSPHDTTSETTFNLTYCTNVMLLMEVGELFLMRQVQDTNLSNEQLRMELDTLQE